MENSRESFDEAVGEEPRQYDAIIQRTKGILNHLGVREGMYKIGDIVAVRLTSKGKPFKMEANSFSSCFLIDQCSSGEAEKKQIQNRWGDSKQIQEYNQLNGGPSYTFDSPIELTDEFVEEFSHDILTKASTLVSPRYLYVTYQGYSRSTRVAGPWLRQQVWNKLPPNVKAKFMV